MLKNNRKKGVTLIELVIALGIMAIVTSLIFFFYFSNQKQLNRVEIKSNLQYEAKKFLESVSKFAMEATDAKWKDGEGKDDEGLLEGKSLSFDLINDRKDKPKKRVVYTLDKKKKVITLKEKEFSREEELETGEWSDPKVICEDVKEMQAVIDSNKIKIILILEKKGVEYKVEESYVFRNSHLK